MHMYNRFPSQTQEKEEGKEKETQTTQGRFFSWWHVHLYFQMDLDNFEGFKNWPKTLDWTFTVVKCYVI